MSITLTEQETKIFTLLLRVVEHYKTQTILRVAGGWVRDKVLHRENDDIDITCDNCSGKEFAEHLVDYCQNVNADYKDACGKVTVIQANPEHSKHLETTTLVVFGSSMDFCNLRCEEYTKESRIPVIRIGTPEEDAFRRDLTINSLFYRIDTKEIEDFTKMGLIDLKNRFIRTPLDPTETFSDDPLRVLRSIRFMSRFQFTLDPEIIKAAKKPEIKEAFIKKISRERIGKEMSLILSRSYGWNDALNILHEIGFLDTIFEPHKNISFSPNDFEFGLKYINTMSSLLSNGIKEKFCITLPEFDGQVMKSLALATFLYPFKDKSYTVRGKVFFATSYIIVEHSLKFSTNDEHIVRILHVCSSNLLLLIEKIKNGESIKRSDLGRFVKSGESYWPLGLFLTFVIVTSISSSDEQESLLSLFNDIGQIIYEEQLSDAYQDKPLFNGSDIMKLYALKGGEWLSRILSELLIWQWDHPDKPLSTKRQCSEENAKSQKRYKIDLICDGIINKQDIKEQATEWLLKRKESI